jgi:RNA polymerase sigma-70 factor (ECF subfamily)
VNTKTSALTTEFLTRLRAFIRRRVRSDHDAEDIMQDVLAKFVQHDSSIDTQSVYAWIFTVARRAVIDQIRASSHQEVAGADVAHRPAGDLEDNPSVTAELARCMEPMLESLDSEDRIILQRADMLGESQADLAHELGMSNSGLKSRVQRARRKLRSILEDCCVIERDRIGQPAEFSRRTDRPCPCDGCD